MHRYYQIRWLRFMPLAIGLLGLPLVLGMVPPNAIYGLRTATTLASNTDWYTANFWSGVTSLTAGLVATVGNLIMDKASSLTPDQKMWTMIASILLVGTVPAIVGLGAA